MSKGIIFSSLSVLTAAALALGVFLFLQTDKLGEARTQISGLEGEVDTLVGDVATLEGNVATLEGEVTTLEGSLASARSTLGTAQAKNTSLTSELNTIKSPRHFTSLAEFNE